MWGFLVCWCGGCDGVVVNNGPWLWLGFADGDEADPFGEDWVVRFL